MKLVYVLGSFLIVCVVVGSLLFVRVYEEKNLSINCVPTFVDGGGPYYKPNSPFRAKISSDENNGEKLVVEGKVVMNDCKTPVAGATIDIWQANETGDYEDEWYRGQIKSGKDGSYRFETVVPKGYGEGTGYRPPHIHFKVWIDGREVITSQMFLPAAREQKIEEAYIMKVESKKTTESVGHLGKHDIVLP